MPVPLKSVSTSGIANPSGCKTGFYEKVTNVKADVAAVLV